MLHWRECHCAIVAEVASSLGQLEIEIKEGKICCQRGGVVVIVIKSDYEPAEALVENPVFHSRTKHTLDKHHFT